MKKFSVVSCLVVGLMLSGCLGYSSIDGNLVGQVKKVTNATPLICGNYKAVDMSMGVMHNGTGSMSAQDVWVSVYTDTSDYTNVINLLNDAAKSGKIVDMTYDEPRIPFCSEHYILKSVKLAPND